MIGPTCPKCRYVHTWRTSIAAVDRFRPEGPTGYRFDGRVYPTREAAEAALCRRNLERGMGSVERLGKLALSTPESPCVTGDSAVAHETMAGSTTQSGPQAVVSATVDPRGLADLTGGRLMGNLKPTRSTTEPAPLNECMADLLAHLREREGRS